MKLLIGDKEENQYLGLEDDTLYIVTLDDNDEETSRIKVGTTTDVASDSSDGLMSSDDKKSLDSLSSNISNNTDSSGNTTTSIGDSTKISDHSSSTSYADTSGSSNQTITKDKITTMIQSILGNYNLASSTNQSNDSLTNSISLNGGSNLIENSSFINGMSNWVTSAGSPTTKDFTSIAGTTAKTALYSAYQSRDKVLQEIDVTQGTKYYLSLVIYVTKADEEFNWSGISLYQNDNLVTNLGQSSVTNGFVSYKKSFTPSTTGSVRLEVFSDADAECYISSLMISTENTSWETNPNDNSYTTMKLDKTGLSISDNQGELKLSNSGVSRDSVVNGQSISVFDINDTLSMIRNLNVLNDLLLGNVKLIPVSGSNAEGLAFL